MRAAEAWDVPRKLAPTRSECAGEAGGDWGCSGPEAVLAMGGSVRTGCTAPSCALESGADGAIGFRGDWEVLRFAGDAEVGPRFAGESTFAPPTGFDEPLRSRGDKAGMGRRLR
jgi:hypothetical protein